MPTLENAKVVFTGNTFYLAWRAYIDRLVDANDVVDFRKKVPRFSNYTAINSTFPARARKIEYDTRFPSLTKHVSGTGHGGADQNWVTLRTTDAAVYDINVGKYKGRWIGGPFFSYKQRKFTTPSPRFDHAMDPYNVPINLGGPGSFYYSDNVTLDVDPFTGPVGFTDCYVTQDPRALFPAVLAASGYVQGARNDADPGRKMYNFGESLAELRDLPRLLKLAGDTFLQRGASAYLSYEFGWKPLIQDVRSLFDFASAIRKRIEFLKLKQGQPIKRKRLLYDLKGTPSTTRTTTAGNGGYGASTVKAGTYQFQDSWSIRSWYKSTIKFDIPGDIPEWRWEQEATNILRGTALDGSLLWQVTPWSWLIDWFSQIGDIIEREFGSSATTTQFLSEWIMVHARTDARLEVPCVWKTNAGSPYIPAGYARGHTYREAKMRQVPALSAAPLLRMENIFSVRQCAILFSLFLSRGKWDGYGK